MNTEKLKKIRARLDAEAAKADKNIPSLLVTEVKRQLIDFCEQSDSFADALENTDKTYDECLKKVIEAEQQNIGLCEQRDWLADALKNIDKTYYENLKKATKVSWLGISGTEAYTRAAKFYMPGAEVKCSMSISTPDSKVIKVNFLDLI